MKKLLILTYVLVVASLSISARASQDIPLLVSSIQHDVDAQVFQIEGQYPNPCINTPSPSLTENKDGQLVLNVTGNTNSEVCISMVGPRFMLAVDLKVLKAELSKLRLDENGVHAIYSPSGELISKVDFSKIFFTITQKTTSIQGTLSYDQSGLFLVDAHGQRYNILSPLINIEVLQDSKVVLTGHMMSHSVSQPFFNSIKPALQFIATGVSYSPAD